MPEHQLKELQKETASDQTLQTLKKAIVDGFPDTKQELPAAIHPYFQLRDELSIHDGILFKGLRCVIPQTLRPRIKAKLHESHIGVQGCLRRAQETIYWPGMNAEITDFIQKCGTCMAYQSNQPKEPLICHEVPSRPWKKIGTDIFTVDDKSYLCTVDYYSGYFEVDELYNKTGTVIINKLKRHFAAHGIPNQLHSDNGPPYNSAEFSNFLKSSGTEHITSSPRYPQSNGRVENAVKTASTLIKKAKESGTEFYLSLLSWRNTPTEGMNSSPAQRIFGRRTRTQLPTAEVLLKPQSTDTEATRDQILKRKEKQTHHYNQHAKELPGLLKGETVRLAPQPGNRSQKWFKAVVQDQTDVRSYNVRTEDGRMFRRNRKHLRSSKEPFYPLERNEPEISPSPQPQIATSASSQDSCATEFHLQEPSTETVQPDESSKPEVVVSDKPQPGQHRITRAGRVSKPPSYLKDYA